MWLARCSFMRAAAHRIIPSLTSQDLDDVAQESCIRLQRALSRRPAENLNGLMTTIARRTACDVWDRGRKIKIVDPSSMIFELPAPCTPEDRVLMDYRSRIRFVVLQFFRKENPACAKLARALFRGVTWKDVAGQKNMSEAAVRQRWSRVCLRALRQKARALGLDVVHEEWLNEENIWK